MVKQGTPFGLTFLKPLHDLIIDLIISLLGPLLSNDVLKVLEPLVVGVIDAGFLLTLIGIDVIMIIWIERKAIARIMSRRGPFFADLPWPIIGKHGLMQNIADFIKFLGKEDIVPDDVDKLTFNLAWFYMLPTAFIVLAIIPLSDSNFIFNPAAGVLYIFGLFSLYPIGVLLIGWSSNNKYSIIGGFRSAAQLISYEIPMVMSVVIVLLVYGDFSIGGLIADQAERGWFLFYGLTGFENIPIFFLPVGIIVAGIYTISMIAETERIPFDLPEAEAELVMGWRTEIAGIRYMMAMAVEYFHMFVNSFLFVILFLGGWHLTFWAGLDFLKWENIQATLGLDQGIIEFLQFTVLWTKIHIVIVFLVIVRGAFGRVRIDQLLDIGWKRLIPWATFMLFLTIGLIILDYSWPTLF